VFLGAGLLIITIVVTSAASIRYYVIRSAVS